MQLIDLKHPLAVLANRQPWTQIGATLAPAFSRKKRDGKVIEESDLFGTLAQMAWLRPRGRWTPAPVDPSDGFTPAPQRPLHLSDKELVERWSENVVWQYVSAQQYHQSRRQAT